eukprot:TRINITY_DN3387_c0_g3_i1.p1 TRINITY_DN3387_c0_g3~~TRINITY_DN3387_c0_g3_i1.p1  ORF type:complete len:247 (-),score=69.27 TRINITY_DN3387_c0_g3_i1:153-893(-)
MLVAGLNLWEDQVVGGCCDGVCGGGGGGGSSSSSGSGPSTQSEPQVTLYVGGLDPHNVTEATLREKFGVYGEIKTLSYKNTNKEGQIDERSAFCFLTFTTPESAAKALESEDSSRWHGRVIRVQFPQSDTEKMERKAKRLAGPPEPYPIPEGYPYSPGYGYGGYGPYAGYGYGYGGYPPDHPPSGYPYPPNGSGPVPPGGSAVPPYDYYPSYPPPHPWGGIGDDKRKAEADPEYRPEKRSRTDLYR